MTTPEPPGTQAEKWIGRTLRIGVWSSAVLMVTGLLAAGMQSDITFGPGQSQTLSEILRWPPTALTIIYLGLFALMFTPFLRVITALLSFTIEKDWRFVAVSSFVFCMLLVEMIVSFR